MPNSEILKQYVIDVDVNIKKAEEELNKLQKKVDKGIKSGAINKDMQSSFSELEGMLRKLSASVEQESQSIKTSISNSLTGIETNKLKKQFQEINQAISGVTDKVDLLSRALDNSDFGKFENYIKAFISPMGELNKTISDLTSTLNTMVEPLQMISNMKLGAIDTSKLKASKKEISKTLDEIREDFENSVGSLDRIIKEVGAASTSDSLAEIIHNLGEAEERISKVEAEKIVASITNVMKSAKAAQEKEINTTDYLNENIEATEEQLKRYKATLDKYIKNSSDFISTAKTNVELDTQFTIPDDKLEDEATKIAGQIKDKLIKKIESKLGKTDAVNVPIKGNTSELKQEITKSIQELNSTAKTDTNLQVDVPIKPYIDEESMKMIQSRLQTELEKTGNISFGGTANIAGIDGISSDVSAIRAILSSGIPITAVGSGGDIKLDASGNVVVNEKKAPQQRDYEWLYTHQLKRPGTLEETTKQTQIAELNRELYNGLDKVINSIKDYFIGKNAGKTNPLEALQKNPIYTTHTYGDEEYAKYGAGATLKAWQTTLEKIVTTSINNIEKEIQEAVKVYENYKKSPLNEESKNAALREIRAQMSDATQTRNINSFINKKDENGNFVNRARIEEYRKEYQTSLENEIKSLQEQAIYLQEKAKIEEELLKKNEDLARVEKINAQMRENNDLIKNWGNLKAEDHEARRRSGLIDDKDELKQKNIELYNEKIEILKNTTDAVYEQYKEVAGSIKSLEDVKNKIDTLKDKPKISVEEAAEKLIIQPFQQALERVSKSSRMSDYIRKYFDDAIARATKEAVNKERLGDKKNRPELYKRKSAANESYKEALKTILPNDDAVINKTLEEQLRKSSYKLERSKYDELAKMFSNTLGYGASLDKAGNIIHSMTNEIEQANAVYQFIRQITIDTDKVIENLEAQRPVIEEIERLRKEGTDESTQKINTLMENDVTKMIMTYKDKEGNTIVRSIEEAFTELDNMIKSVIHNANVSKKAIATQVYTEFGSDKKYEENKEKYLNAIDQLKRLSQYGSLTPFEQDEKKKYSNIVAKLREELSIYEDINDIQDRCVVTAKNREDEEKKIAERAEETAKANAKYVDYKFSKKGIQAYNNVSEMGASTPEGMQSKYAKLSVEELTKAQKDHELVIKELEKTSQQYSNETISNLEKEIELTNAQIEKEKSKKNVNEKKVGELEEKKATLEQQYAVERLAKLQEMASARVKKEIQERIKYLEEERQAYLDIIKDKQDTAAKNNKTAYTSYEEHQVEKIDQALEHLKNGTAEANKELERSRVELENIKKEITTFESEKMSSLFGIKNPEEAQKLLSIYERMAKASEEYRDASQKVDYNNFVNSSTAIKDLLTDEEYKDGLQYLDDAKSKVDALKEELKAFARETNNTKLMGAFTNLDDAGKLGFSDELSKYMEKLRKRNDLQKRVDYLKSRYEDENGNPLSYEASQQQKIVGILEQKRSTVENTLNKTIEQKRVLDETVSQKKHELELDEKANKEYEKRLKTNVSKERASAEKQYKKDNDEIETQLKEQQGLLKNIEKEESTIIKRHEKKINLAQQEVELRQKELFDAQAAAQKEAKKGLDTSRLKNPNNQSSINRLRKNREVRLEELNQEVNKRQEALDLAKQQLQAEIDIKNNALKNAKIDERKEPIKSEIDDLERKKTLLSENYELRKKDLSAIEEEQKKQKETDKRAEKEAEENAKRKEDIAKRTTGIKSNIEKENEEKTTREIYEQLGLDEKISTIKDLIAKSTGEEKVALENELTTLEREYVAYRNLQEAAEKYKESAKETPVAERLDELKEERQALKGKSKNGGTGIGTSNGSVRAVSIGDLATESTLQKVLTVLSGGKIPVTGKKGGVELSDVQKSEKGAAITAIQGVLGSGKWSAGKDTSKNDALLQLFKENSNYLDYYGLRKNKEGKLYPVNANYIKDQDIQMMKELGLTFSEVAKEAGKASTASKNETEGKKESSDASEKASKSAKDLGVSLQTMQKNIEKTLQQDYATKNNPALKGKLNKLGEKPLSMEALSTLAKTGIDQGFIAQVYGKEKNKIKFKQPWEDKITDEDIELTNALSDSKEKLTRKILEAEKAQHREAAAAKKDTEESKANLEASKQRAEATKQFVDNLLKGRKKTKEYSFKDLKDNGLLAADVKKEIASRGWESRGNQEEGYVVKLAEAWKAAAAAEKDYFSASKKDLEKWSDGGDKKAAAELERRAEKKKDNVKASKESAQAEKEEAKATEESAEKVVQAEEKKNKSRSKKKNNTKDSQEIIATEKEEGKVAEETADKVVKAEAKKQTAKSKSNKGITAEEALAATSIPNINKAASEASDKWAKAEAAIVLHGEEAAKQYINSPKKFKKENYDAWVDFAEAGVNATKEALGIHSPSVVFEKLGEYCGEGFKIGILNSFSDLKKAIIGALQANIITKDEINELAGWKDGKDDNGKAVFDRRYNEQKQQLENLKNAASEVYNGVLSGAIKETVKEQNKHTKAIERTNEKIRAYFRDLERYKDNIRNGNITDPKTLSKLFGSAGDIEGQLFKIKDTKASNDEIDRINEAFIRFKDQIRGAESEANKLAREEAKAADEAQRQLKSEEELLRLMVDVRYNGESKNKSEAEKAKILEEEAAKQKELLDRDIEQAEYEKVKKEGELQTLQLEQEYLNRLKQEKSDLESIRQQEQRILDLKNSINNKAKQQSENLEKKNETELNRLARERLQTYTDLQKKRQEIALTDNDSKKMPELLNQEQRLKDLFDEQTSKLKERHAELGKSFDRTADLTQLGGIRSGIQSDTLVKLGAQIDKENSRLIKQETIDTNQLNKAYSDLIQQKLRVYQLSQNGNVPIKQLEDEKRKADELRDAYNKLTVEYKKRYGKGKFDENLNTDVLRNVFSTTFANTEKIQKKYSKQIDGLTPDKAKSYQSILYELTNLDSAFEKISTKGIDGYILKVQRLQENLVNLLTGIRDAGTLDKFDNINSMFEKMSDAGFQTGKIDLFKQKLEGLIQDRDKLFNNWTGAPEDIKALDELIAKVKELYATANGYNETKGGKEHSIIKEGTIKDTKDLAAAMMELANARGYSNAKLKPYVDGQKTLTLVAKDATGQQFELSASINDVTNSMMAGQPVIKQNASFWQSYGATLKQAFSTFGYYLGFAALVRKTMQEFRQGIQTLKTFDSALTTISYTMNLSQQELKNLGQSAVDMAEDLSMSMENALKVYQIYANMQTTVSDIEQVSKPTAILSNLSGVDASTAADQVQGILQQFNMLKDGEKDLADTSMHVVDVLDKISANVAIDYSKGINIISEAVTATGQVAHDAGMSFEELAAITAKVAERTREDGSTIGNALKTMFVRISKVSKMPQYADEVDNEQLSKASKALHDIGIEVYNANGEFNNITDTLTQLNKKWDTLNDVQKSNISFQVAATRQSAKFKSMLEAWTDAMELANEATKANGNALENQEKFEESYTGKLQRLQTEWQEFWLNLLNSDGFKDLLDELTQLLAKINDFADSTSHVGVVIGGLGFASVISSLFKIGRQIIANKLLVTSFGKATNTALSQASTGVTKYSKTWASASTSIKNGINGIGNALKSIAPILAAIAAAYSIYKFVTVQSEINKAVNKAADEYKENIESLDDYKNRISELQDVLNDHNSTLEDQVDARKQILDLQKDMIDKFGSEAGQVDVLTGSVKDLNEEFDKLKEKEFKEFLLVANDDSWHNWFDSWDDFMHNVNKLFRDAKNWTGPFTEPIDKRSKTQTIRDQVEHQYFNSDLNELLQGEFKSRGYTTNQLNSIAKTKLGDFNAFDYYDDLLDLIDKYQKKLEADPKNKDISSSLKWIQDEANRIRQLLYDEEKGIAETYSYLFEYNEIYNNYKDEIKQINNAREELKEALENNDDDLVQKKASEINSIINDISENADSSTKRWIENFVSDIQTYLSENEFEVQLKAKGGWLDQEINYINDVIKNSADVYGLFNQEDLITLAKREKIAPEDVWAYSQQYGPEVVDVVRQIQEIAEKYDIPVELVVKNIDVPSFAVKQLQDKLGQDINLFSDDDIKTLVENVPDVMSMSVSQMQKALEDLHKELQKPIMSKSGMIDQLNELSEGFDKLDEIYADIYDKGGFDFAKLDSKKFKEAFEELGVNYEDFIETVAGHTDDIEYCQEAFNSLVDEYIRSSGVLDNVSAETANLTAKMLEMYGVTNADVIVQEALEKQEAATVVAKYDLVNATASEIQELQNEISASDGVRASLIAAQAAEVLFANTDLNVEQKINDLRALASAAWGAAAALEFSELTDNRGYDKSYDPSKYMSTEEAWNKIQSKYTKMAETKITTAQYGGGEKTRSAIDKANKSAEESKEILDWIEKALQRQEEEINRIDKVVNATYKNWSNRNSALLNEITEINKEIGMQQAAYQAYMRDAEAVPLAENYKKLVREGAMFAETITDKTLKKNIDHYTELYDKAIKAKDAVEDLIAKIAQLAKMKFDNVKSEFEGFTSEIEHFVNMIDKELSHVEAMDKIAGKSFYKAKIDQDAQKLEDLNKERTALLSALREAEANGIEEGSADWISMRNDIYAVDESIAELTYEVEELRKKMKEVAKLNFDDLKSQFGNAISIITGQIDLTDTVVSMTQNAGYIASREYYKALIDGSKENVTGLRKEYETLSKTLADAMSAGDIEKYDEQWYAMQQDITNVKKELVDAANATIEYANALRQINWDVFDRGVDRISKLVDESEFFIELLSYSDLFDKDSGDWTKEGTTTRGLMVQEYQTYVDQANAYGEEAEEIRKLLETDPKNTTLIDRYYELIEAQRQAILNSKKEKKAIEDLYKDAYDNLLDRIKKLIDAYKDALNAAKDLHDYQNSIEEKTKAVSDIQKQLIAYNGDDSEETRATLQKLNTDLIAAQKDLEQTEYEKYIQDQENLLDQFYNELEEWLNGRMDELSSLFEEAIAATNLNGKLIDDTLHDVSDSVNYRMTDEFSTIWDNYAAEDGIAANSLNILTLVNDMSNSIRVKMDELPTEARLEEFFNGDDLRLLQQLTSVNYNTQTMISSIRETNDALNHINSNVVEWSGRLGEKIDYAGSRVASAIASIEFSSDSGSYDAPSGSGGSGGGGGATPSSSSSPVYSVVNSLGQVYTSHTSNPDKYVAEANKKVEAEAYNYAMKQPSSFQQRYNDYKQKHTYRATSAVYKRGGLIGKEDNILDSIAQLFGEDHMVAAKEGERILTEEQNKNFEKMVNANFIPLDESLKEKYGALSGNGDLNRMINSMSGIQNPRIGSGINMGNTTTVGDINISLPNVTNKEEFISWLKNDGQIEKIVQSMTVGRMMGGNSYAKLKY